MQTYYDILGVQETASIEDIRKAFRARIRQCHPDHGGSHDEAVRVVEAWDVLSNPDHRALYDRARHNPTDNEAAAASAENVSSARATAQRYTASWEDLDRYVEAVQSDFAKAHYLTGQGWGGFDWIENSWSGAAFIIIGGAIGLSLAAFIVSLIPRGVRDIPAAILFIVALTIGTKLGRQLHESIRGHFERQTSAAPTRANAQIIIACIRCGQRLRIPAIDKTLSVQCSSCKNEFVWPAP